MIISLPFLDISLPFFDLSLPFLDLSLPSLPGEGGWTYCNYDDCNAGTEVGFPRDCCDSQEEQAKLDKGRCYKRFHNLPKGSHMGQPTSRFYVWAPLRWGLPFLLITALMSAAYVGGASRSTACTMLQARLCGHAASFSFIGSKK